MPFGALTATTNAESGLTKIECHVDGTLVAAAWQDYRGWFVDDIDIEATPVQRFNTRTEAEAALEILATTWAMTP